jgi:peptide/nickel transport system substrate-binding protein
MNIPADLLSTLRRQQGVYLNEALGGAVQFLFLNPRTPPLDDPAVRRALSLAIDRQSLAEQVLGGTVDVAEDVYSPIYTWALKHAYPSDIARATRLLDEAGWRIGADGVRAKDGKLLSFTVLWYPQRTDLQPMGIALQAQLRALGVRIELKMVEQINAALKAPDWGGALYYNNTAPGGDPQYLLDTFVKSGGVTNFGYASAGMDQLVEQIRSAVDSGQRANLVRQAQDRLAEHALLIPLVAKKEIFAVNERLRNVQPHPVSVYVIDAAFGR